MSFVKVTAPKRLVSEVKVNRTNFVISPAGLDSISKLAPSLADASLVNLWWDAETGMAAITAADQGDPDATPLEREESGARIPAKQLFEYASLRPGTKLTSDQFKSSGTGGVAVVFAGLTLPHPAVSAVAAPKRRGRKPKNFGL